MKISANDIRPGNVLEHKDRLWGVVRTEHVKPGKGPAYQQVELKDLVDGTKLNERFRAVETVERNSDKAVRRGVFGVPSYVVGDEVFWGQDRLALLEAHLAALG